jgi:hypothetical protein
LKNNSLANIRLEQIEKIVEVLIENSKLEKVSTYKLIEHLSNELKSLNEKLGFLENHLKKEENSSLSKEEILSSFFSSEFEELQDTTLKKLKYETERKFEKEKAKMRFGKNISIFSISLSIIAITFSLVIYFTNL